MKKWGWLKAVIWGVACWPLTLCATSQISTSNPLMQRSDSSLVQPAKIKGAAPDRLFEFGMAFGLPILASPEVSIQIFKRIQVGSYFGYVPGAFIPQFRLPKMSQKFFNNFTYEMYPVGNTAAVLMASPFVRYFPTERTFYFQLTWSVARSSHKIESPLKETITGIEVPGATISSLVTLTEMLPTLSIGYFFWKHVYFLNVSLGATILLTPSATATLKAELPLGLGGNLNNQSALANIQRQLDTSMGQAIDQIRSVLPFVPSVMISTGIMF